MPNHRNRILAILIATAACGEQSGRPSRLAQRAASTIAAPVTGRPAGTPQAADEPAAGASARAATPAPDAERVELRLALEDPTVYRVQTFGEVKLPLSPRGSMFVREARVRVHDCQGEDHGRRCQLEHRYTNFEAEPGIRGFLQTDYDRVKDLVTSHSVTATGLRADSTRIEGPTPHADLAAALADAHRLYCLRFPNEPVAVGAQWRDTCRLYARGTVATREVVWELASVSEDPDGLGKRAELTVAGSHAEPNASGTVRGILYFYVDLGEPRLLHETISMSMSDKAHLVSTTTLRHVFGKVLPGEPEKVVQTSGRPFDSEALSSAPLPSAPTPSAPPAPDPGARPAR